MSPKKPKKSTRKKAPVDAVDMSARKVRFHGREWTVVRVDMEDYQTLDRALQGEIHPQHNIIFYRAGHPDTEIITMLHELEHYCFPQLEEDSVERGDATLKDALEAFGVDLSPLTGGGK